MFKHRVNRARGDRVNGASSACVACPGGSPLVHMATRKKEKSADDVCRRGMPAYYLEIAGRWRNSLLERMNYY